MPSRATHVEARLAELPVGHPRQREIFYRTQVLKPTEMAFPHSPPTRHCTQMHPLSLQLAVALLPPSLPPALTAWEWKGGIQSISPTSRCGPPSCAPPACAPPSCACPSCVAPSCSASLAEVMGSHPSFHGHKATPRPAAPHPLAALAALAAASPHSYYRSPRPGLSISHRRADPWCLGRMLAEALPTCRGNGGE